GRGGVTGGAAIEMRGVAFRYEGAAGRVFEGLDLAIPAGTATAVLGANGCGKTTLLRLMLGVEKPEAGDIRLGGREASGMGRRERARWVGWVPQAETVPFELTVEEYALLGRAPHLHPLAMPGEEDAARAREALERVGLSRLAGRPVTRLSGGELQLATIARALAQNPKILLLDEPTSHLDLANRAGVQRVLEGLSRDGTTLVFTTHDPLLAAASAERVVLMAKGRVLGSGSVEEMFTAEKLSAVYGMPVAVERAGGRWWVG
ncbi:MAG: ABC transporter ATP-binding protein, partial [Kiritimatiellae bacterium]|nr:ABC transporter ATP-binding protein [Kiritimatiellia bacterium]